MSLCRTALRRAARSFKGPSSSSCSTPAEPQIPVPLQGLTGHLAFQTESLSQAVLGRRARCIASIGESLLDDAFERQPSSSSSSASACTRHLLHEGSGITFARGFSSRALARFPASTGSQPTVSPPRPEIPVAGQVAAAYVATGQGTAGQVGAGNVETVASASGTQGLQQAQSNQSVHLSAELQSPPSSITTPPPLSPPGTAAAHVGHQDVATPLPSFHRQPFPTRQMSLVTHSPTPSNRKAFFLDTLALVRRLEAEGLTPQQAEAITHVITDVLHESLDSAGRTFVSNSEIQKMELVHEAGMSRLKTELQSSSDIRLAGLQREVEGLRTDLDKVKSELRYEVDKVTAGQRLDLNLERGRVKEELNLFAQETSNLTNKLDREVNSLKASLEAAKFDVIRYCVGTLVSVSAVGLGMLRILM